MLPFDIGEAGLQNAFAISWLPTFDIDYFMAVDGISLTVVEADNDSFSVALIPHTLEMTTLGRRAVGDHPGVDRAACRARVEALYSAEAITGAYLAVYHSLSGGGSDRAGAT